MLTVIIKVLAFLLIILLGYVSKKRGLVKKEDSIVLGKIVLNITLPCALLSSVRDISLSIHELPIIVFALFANVAALLIIRYINRKNDKKTIAISMLGASGYNIGAFLLPFVQFFFNSSMIIYVILFDIGNSLMVFSGNNAIATSVIHEKKGSLIKDIIRKSLHSVPFMTYIFILVLSFFRLSIPDELLIIINIPANANIFLSMFLVGCMLDLDINMDEFKVCRNIIVFRYLNSFIMIAFLFILPLSYDIRLMLTLALLAPASVMSAIQSNDIDSKSVIPAIINTVSAIISIALIVTIIIFVS